MLKTITKKKLTNGWTWLLVSFAVWFCGFGGTDLYAVFLLPAVYFFFQNGWERNIPVFFKHIRTYFLLIMVACAILVVLYIAKTISFSWKIFDVGSYANSLFNWSNGVNYNSYLNIPATADHFFPSLIVLVPLFWIYPTGFWIVFVKLFAYILTPFLYLYFIRHRVENKVVANFSAIFFFLAYFIFYKPVISSVYFEFSPSSLAPPFLIAAYFFLKDRKHILFGLTVVFLLGLKEHMGLVLIGYGLYLFFNDRKKSGFFLATFGFFFTVFIVFFVMPYMSMGYGTFGANSEIAILDKLVDKIHYVLLLLAPLLFLPLKYWRIGILALPAVGANLIAKKDEIISTEYHYDDISGTLLVLSASLAILKYGNEILAALRQIKIYKYLPIACVLLVAPFLPHSGLYRLYDKFPDKSDLKIRSELAQLKREFPAAGAVLQNNLGAYWMAFNVSKFENMYEYTDNPVIEISSAVDSIGTGKSFGGFVSDKFAILVKPFFMPVSVTIQIWYYKVMIRFSNEESVVENYVDKIKKLEKLIESMTASKTTFLDMLSQIDIKAALFQEEKKYAEEKGCAFSAVRDNADSKAFGDPELLIFTDDNESNAYPLRNKQVCFDYIDRLNNYKKLPDFHYLRVYRKTSP